MNKNVAITLIVIVVVALGVAAFASRSNAPETTNETGSSTETFSLPTPSNDDSVDSLERDAQATNFDGIDAGFSAELESEFTKE